MYTVEIAENGFVVRYQSSNRMNCVASETWVFTNDFDMQDFFRNKLSEHQTNKEK